MPCWMNDMWLLRLFFLAVLGAIEIVIQEGDGGDELLDGLVKWWKKWRRKRKREKAKKKPMEFSKILAVWATSIATGAVIASYTLPIFYRESVSDVTTTVFTACIGYLITYAGKSLGEKVSRNKHRLDADGNPCLMKSLARGNFMTL